MITFKQFLIEDVAKNELKTAIEPYMDGIGVNDVIITGHFLDRVNDEDRNGYEITIQELVDLFKKQFTRNKTAIAKLRDNEEVTLVDQRSNINIGVIKDYDVLKLKTVMRKKNFRTSDRRLFVF